MTKPEVEGATPRPAESPETRRSHSHQWTAPLSTEDRAQLHREAVAVLGAMCAKGAWTMSVPVRETDSDMVLCAALHDAKLLEAELASTRAALREAQEDTRRLAALWRVIDENGGGTFTLWASEEVQLDEMVMEVGLGESLASLLTGCADYYRDVDAMDEDAELRAALDSAAGEGPLTRENAIGLANSTSGGDTSEMVDA